MSTERDIEYLAEWHPYLIDPELTGLLPERQLKKGRFRLDMLFPLKSGKCIVELKKTALDGDDLKQLIRYCRIWSKTHRLARHHYLVGKKPEAETFDQLLSISKSSPFRIRFRFLGVDIPLALAWSEKSECYIPYDDSKHSAHVIRIKI
jgi:hypothetical protein